MKKILVRSPFKEEEISYSLPFYKMLYSEFPDADVYVIVEEGSEEIFKLISLPLKVFTIPKGKQTVLGLHKFCVNLNDVFNVDLYFDLLGENKSSLIGKMFNAKEKVGYVKGLNKFLLTHKVELKKFNTPDGNYLNLLENYLNKDLTSQNIIASQFEKNDEEDKLFKDSISNRIIISMNIFDDSFVDDNWKNFFDLFSETLFVFIVEVDVYIKKLIPKLNAKNEYKVIPLTDKIETKKVFDDFEILLTDRVWKYPLALEYKLDVIPILKNKKDLPLFKTIESPRGIIQLDEGQEFEKIHLKDETIEIMVSSDVVDFIVD